MLLKGAVTTVTLPSWTKSCRGSLLSVFSYSPTQRKVSLERSAWFVVQEMCVTSAV